MTKAELIDSITNKLEMRKKDVAPVVDAVFAEIQNALAKGDKCTFVGFGVLRLERELPERDVILRILQRLFLFRRRRFLYSDPAKILKKKFLTQKFNYVNL